MHLNDFLQLSMKYMLVERGAGFLPKIQCVLSVLELLTSSQIQHTYMCHQDTAFENNILCIFTYNTLINDLNNCKEIG